jgi:hypothetical protein
VRRDVPDGLVDGDARRQRGRKMFKGADCELCKSPSEWKIVRKMID